MDFTEIPVMSNDGAYEAAQSENKNNELKEDEQEDMILDTGKEYKMVSIMRQKGRQLVSNPYDDPNKLTQIEEEEAGQPKKKQKWTNALPRFGKEEDEEEKKQAVEEDSSTSMAFDETADIKVQSDNMKMRQKLMSRLVQNNILESSRPKVKSYQTIIIWDWDDTMMASTYLSQYQSRILEPSVRKRLPKPAQLQLDQLQDLVIKLLKKSVSLGTTYIITNAGQGWVELSSGRFLPLLHK